MSDCVPATLADIQARLQQYVLEEESAVAGSIGNRIDMSHLLHELKSTSPEQGKRRLRVYKVGYRLRMREVLQGAFENTWAYLGDEAFDAVCLRYIKTNPSQSPNLRNYGSDLPGFLERILPNDPEVAELATMDWRLHNAFDAPNAPTLTGDQLASIDEAQWASLGFRFHPSVSIARFEWNAMEIWHAIDQDKVPPVAGKLNAPIGHLFWRGDQHSCFRTLAVDEYEALQGLLEGASFAQVCEQLVQHSPDTAIDASIGSWLARWLSDGLLSEVLPEPDAADTHPIQEHLRSLSS